MNAVDKRAFIRIENSRFLSEKTLSIKKLPKNLSFVNYFRKDNGVMNDDPETCEVQRILMNILEELKNL